MSFGWRKMLRKVVNNKVGIGKLTAVPDNLVMNTYKRHRFRLGAS
jgi:hypothetical protein